MPIQVDRPSFLTTEREQRFLQVGNALNRHLQTQKAQNQHLQQHMSNYMKSHIRRGYLSGVIGDYFSSDEDTIPRFDFNMYGLQFDEEWFARVIKVEMLDDEKPPKLPRKIRQAITRAMRLDMNEQETLFDLSEFEDNQNPILSFDRLRHGIIGYIVGITGLIIGFTFAEYDLAGYRISNIYTVDLDNGALMNGVSATPDFDPSNPSTTININRDYLPRSDGQDEAQ